MKIEIQFDHKNQNFYFRPLDRNIRGHFLLSRVAEPTAMSWRDRIPEDIPGQILGVDTETGTGYILEPVHGIPLTKQMIERRGMTLEPERQEFANVDVDAWLYWMAAIVKTGNATIKSGKLPETIAYDPPSRLQPQPKRGPARRREIFEAHPEVAATYVEWDASKRKEWEALVGV